MRHVPVSYAGNAVIPAVTGADQSEHALSPSSRALQLGEVELLHLPERGRDPLHARGVFAPQPIPQPARHDLPQQGDPQISPIP